MSNGPSIQGVMSMRVLRSGLARPVASCRMLTVARAWKKSDGSEKRQKDHVRKAVEQMRKDGIDEKVARKVMQAWKDKKGITDAKQLRDNVTKFGVSVFALAVLQLVTDVIGSFCAGQTASIISAQEFFGAGGIAFMLQVLSVYFGLNAALDFFRIGTVIGSTLVMGTRAESLYEAIEELAGQPTSISLLNKVEAAVSTSKVALALNSIRQALQDEYQTGPVDMGTLGNLTSYFVLQHAKKEYDWTPEKAGISNDQANEAAAIFARFDGNEDYRLEMSEFKKLCNAAQFTLTDEEVMKAMELLDKRASGYIEFDEFSSWWVEKGGKVAGKGPGASTMGAAAKPSGAEPDATSSSSSSSSDSTAESKSEPVKKAAEKAQT